MFGPVDERTPPMTPQLALRVAIAGGIALMFFAVIFFRLWFLQVLSGSHYVAEAQSNVIQKIPVAAPRGEVVDSTGTPLVESVQVPSIQIAPRSLPVPIGLDASVSPPVPIPAGDEPLFNRLANVIGMSTRPRSCKYIVFWKANHYSSYDVRLAPIPCLIAQSVSQSSYANATIKTNVPTYVQDYIQERIAEFPGVLSQDTYVRKYPLGNAGAQLFGTLGQLTQPEFGTKPYKGIAEGNVVGQSGLEAQYNWALQGINGKERVRVNSQGQFQGYAKSVNATPGDTLQLSLDARLEQVGQQSLAQSIALNHGTGGAFVALDPDNGQVYAMGSAPSYQPSVFTKPVSNAEYKRLFGPGSGDPLQNNAIDGVGPDGSTFKVITATAALQSGVWGLNDSFDENTLWCYPGTTDCLHNSDDESFGPVDLVTAIQDSVDTFFYNLGYLLNGRPILTADHRDGGELQLWARRYGLGQQTGVDLPGEATGEVPTPALLTERYKLEMECEHATGVYAYTDPATGATSATKQPGFVRSKKTPGGCGISNSSVQSWTVGDNVNTAVGQGFVQVTPLQLAVVYAALANGGKVITPHLGQAIESPTGQVIQRIDPAAKRTLHIDPAYLQAIRQGLYDAAHAGTSADVMGNFPEPVYGKTGTAQKGNGSDDAWYACFVPSWDTNKPIVVVTWVENGGYGDVAAAPVARQILSQWFLGKPGPYASGTNTTL